jgi:hypothetical protein
VLWSRSDWGCFVLSRHGWLPTSLLSLLCPPTPLHRCLRPETPRQILTCGKEEYKTEVVDKTLDPVWRTNRFQFGAKQDLEKQVFVCDVALSCEVVMTGGFGVAERSGVRMCITTA